MSDFARAVEDQRLDPPDDPDDVLWEMAGKWATRNGVDFSEWYGQSEDVSLEQLLDAVLNKRIAAAEALAGKAHTLLADEIFHSQELCDVLGGIASQFPAAAHAVDDHNARLVRLFKGARAAQPEPEAETEPQYLGMEDGPIEDAL